MIRLLFALVVSATLLSCNSTKSGGGDRYRYPEAKVGSAKTIKFASTDGRFVGLSDGSLWNVDWSSAGAARSLRPGQPVRVDQSGGGSFPYVINPQGGAPVRARLGKKLD